CSSGRAQLHPAQQVFRADCNLLGVVRTFSTHDCSGFFLAGSTIPVEAENAGTDTGGRTHMKFKILLAALFALGSSFAWGFCGFYVGKADSKLFNKASQVILARQENRTILTMANDYHGEMKDFALVVPVPVVLQKDQVHVGDPKVLERLDAF